MQFLLSIEKIRDLAKSRNDMNLTFDSLIFMYKDVNNFIIIKTRLMITKEYKSSHMKISRLTYMRII
jgi:hypothetical protein